MSVDVLLLGATGSIGQQTIELCAEQKDFHIVGVSLNRRYEILEKMLPLLPYLKTVGIRDSQAAEAFFKAHKEFRVISGDDINIRLAKEEKYQKAVNALVGEEGFLPSLTVLQENKDLCLANKESLVIGGQFIKDELKKGHGRLFAIDSEHVALAKLLKNANREEILNLIITASGGSLRDVPLESLKDVTLKEVLHHPTWQMGTRITVDSATMVNKGFEFIEASYLYDWPIDRIQVLINDESEVHSALQMKDNSYLFEVGPSDMKIPISYALNEGKRVASSYKSADFNRKCSLNFRSFDKIRYPLFQLVLNTFKLGGTAMAFLNAVDEEAVKRFAAGQMTYLEMTSFVMKTVTENMASVGNPSPADVVETDRLARKIVASKLD